MNVSRLPLAAVAAPLFLLACQDPSGPRPVPETRLAAAASSSRVPQVIPGQYVVRFEDDVADPAGLARQLTAAHGGTLRYTYRHAIKGFAAALPDAAAAALANNPNVAYVEPDMVVRLVTTQAAPPSWGLDRIDQATLPLDKSYSYTPTGYGVRAYIIDTGILYGHQEFVGRATPGYDAVTANGGAVDCHGHGTHVSGTVGGTNVGVAKLVQLVGVRVLDCTGEGTNSGVIAGIDWVTADHAAGAPAVANMSLGGDPSTAVDDAVRASIADGVTYAIAAGNGFFGLWPEDACGTTPARVAEALTVSATDSRDTRASWANYGTCVDIFAPGIGIFSSWYAGTNYYNTIDGTSMATPHVTGAAALYLETNSSASPAQVASAILGGASLNKVLSPGTGSPNRLLYTGFMNVTPPATPPAAPSGLTATASSSSQIALSWTDNSSDESGFDIERCTGATCTDFAPLASVGANVVSFTNGGLAASTSYSYRVKAKNAAGSSGYSEPASAATAAAPVITLVARYSWSCTAGGGRTCNFNGSSSTGTISSWSWNFGDGAVGSGAQVGHRYTARNASYSVTLTVTAPDGSTTSTAVCTVTTGATGSCQ